MSWKCLKCNHPRYKITESGLYIICVNCKNCTEATKANEGVSISPGPNKSLNANESSDDSIERQTSYDKSKKKLRGAAKKSKVSKIMKERADVGDEDDLIDMNELTSTSEGMYIENRNIRSNKARNLKKKLSNLALELNRSCG